MEGSMKIHYSELDLYLQCPQAYYQRYVLGVKDEQESSALHFGTALHLAIKNHFEGEDGLETFRMYWESMKSVDMVYYRHNWEMLNDLAINKFIPNFIKFHAKKYSNPVMEQLCEIPLFMHPMHGQIYLEGTFDMFSEYGGIPTMTDWKTSSAEYKKFKLDKNPQLYIYSALYKEKYGALPKAIQYKVFRKDNGSIQTLQKELTEQDLTRQLDNCTAIIKMMLNSRAENLWPHSFSCFCK
jgi:hypothetical protein